MKILVGCEESQKVTKALRALGHTAFSCDTQKCSGGRPKWHLKMDVLKAIKLVKWDAAIFFPPCTYLANSGNRWFKNQVVRRSGVLVGKARRLARFKAIEFFKRLYNCGIKKLAIENPIGIISSVFRKPDQIIHPFQFGDAERKATCLWLKGLPKLKPTRFVKPRIIYHQSGASTSQFYFNALTLSPEERSKIRSTTFGGIANAMARQWFPTPA